MQFAFRSRYNPITTIGRPLIGLALGKVNFAGLSLKIGESEIKYGNFIQTIVGFVIVAFCIFIVIQIFEKFKKKQRGCLVIDFSH